VLEELYLRVALWWRARTQSVQRELGRRAYPRRLWLPEVGSVRVAAVAAALRPIRKVTELADQAYHLTRMAVEEGAELVVFPDHLFLPLLGLVPGVPQWLEGAQDLAAALDAQGPHPAAEGLTLADVAAVASRAADRLYQLTFSTLARRFQVYIAAGAIWRLERDGRVVPVAHVFDPSGRLVLTQARTHLLPWERRWGLGVGSEVRVADSALGRLTVLGEAEVEGFEVPRIAAFLGAEILLATCAHQGVPLPAQVWSGLWARVQETLTFGVRSVLVGEALGLRFGGSPAIYAPLELSPGGDGILAQEEQSPPSLSHAGRVLTATLDVAGLRELREGHPLLRNDELNGLYLPELYTHPWPWNGTGREEEVEGQDEA
jgi:predicted amidohydrolase